MLYARSDMYTTQIPAGLLTHALKHKTLPGLSPLIKKSCTVHLPPRQFQTPALLMFPAAKTQTCLSL